VVYRIDDTCQALVVQSGAGGQEAVAAQVLIVEVSRLPHGTLGPVQIPGEEAFASPPDLCRPSVPRLVAAWRKVLRRCSLHP